MILKRVLIIQKELKQHGTVLAMWASVMLNALLVVRLLEEAETCWECIHVIRITIFKGKLLISFPQPKYTSMKKICFQILFVILASACQNKEPVFTAFECSDTERLSGKILSSTFIFSDPAEMVLVDSLLIIHDSQKKDSCFHIFNVNNGLFLKSFGHKGRGPGEVIFPASMNYSPVKQAITTYEPNLRKIVCYNIGHILNGQPPFFSEIQIKESPSFVTQAIPYENKFILRGCDDKMRFGRLDDTLKVNSIYTDYHRIVNDQEENWAIINYTPQWAIRPDESKMVMTTYIGSIFEIFNIRDGIIEYDTIQFYYPPIYRPLKGFKPKWVGTTPETIIGCYNIYVTNEYIYTIYEGESAKKNQIHKKLILFDWKGRVHKKYEFTEGDPVSICVDEVNKKFYCVILNHEYEYQIYSYDYSHSDNSLGCV